MYSGKKYFIWTMSTTAWY